VRPAYETSANIAAEQSVAQRLEQLWSCKLVKTPRFYEFDYAITQDLAVKAFCEIKVREKHYQTLLLSLHKWKLGLEMAGASGLPFLLVAKTPAGLFYMTAVKKPYAIEMRGRTDRNDDQDIEPCILIPYSDMTKVKE